MQIELAQPVALNVAYKIEIKIKNVHYILYHKK